MGWFGRKADWPQLPADEIRKRSKLLVIDDQQFDYVSLFEKDGYNIEKWDDIVDLPKLESGYYDVILLDIQGVGKQQSSNEQGFGILKHLKKVRPPQIIIAYSNADYAVKYQDFFSMADAAFSKASDYVDFKRKVDELLISRFSMGFYVDKIIALASPHTSDMGKIRKLSRKAIAQRNANIVKPYLEGVIDDKELITTILRIIGCAIELGKVIWP